MMEKPPADPADHAQEFSRRWADRLEEYCAVRMEELGVPDDKLGEPDYEGSGRWHVFDPHGRTAGSTITGVVVNSGVFNPDLLKGEKGGRIWPKARLRDRIDATIAHELAESESYTHQAALKEAAHTKLPISVGARRICKAMAR
jgi:hypothetical protein